MTRRQAGVLCTKCLCREYPLFCIQLGRVKLRRRLFTIAMFLPRVDIQAIVDKCTYFPIRKRDLLGSRLGQDDLTRVISLGRGPAEDQAQENYRKNS